MMYIAHILVAACSFDTLYRHGVCFKEEADLQGAYNLDGQLLLTMATVQVGFVLLSKLFKMRMPSVSDLLARL